MPNLSDKWSSQPKPSISEKINDTIKHKGYRVSASEIEAKILEHYGLKPAASIPDM